MSPLQIVKHVKSTLESTTVVRALSATAHLPFMIFASGMGNLGQILSQ